jgi:hypothetical protein
MDTLFVLVFEYCNGGKWIGALWTADKLNASQDELTIWRGENQISFKPIRKLHVYTAPRDIPEIELPPIIHPN